jgi:hypothetical protein
MTHNNHIHGGYSIVLIVFICVNFLSYKFKFQSLCSRNAYCKNANFVSTKPIVLTPSCKQYDPRVWVVHPSQCHLDVLINHIQLGVVQLRNNLQVEVLGHGFHALLSKQKC